MGRAFARCFVLLALILAGEAHPAAEKEASQRAKSRDADSSLLNTDSTTPVKENFTPFGTNACLYVSPSLPACNFHRNERSADNAGDPRTYTKDSFDPINDRPHSLNPKLTSRNAMESLATDVMAVGLTVYKIEGCLPSRLPFDMPLCKDLASIRKVTDVRRLYPFTVSKPARSPNVFPEFDLEAWMRTMNGMRANRGSTTDDSAKEDGRNGLTPNAMVAAEYKKESRQVPVIDPELTPTSNDRSGKQEVPIERDGAKREVPFREIIDDEDRPVNMKRETRAIFGRAWNSNPFANTIFLEPSQNLDGMDELRAWNKASEPIESEPFAFEPEFDDLNDLRPRQTTDRSIRQRRQSKLNNEIGEKWESHGSDSSVRRKDDGRRKSRDIEAGREFPYRKAIPYDPKKLILAGISTKVDDNRSRKTRDTLYGLTRNSFEDWRGAKGKLGARKDMRGDKVGIGRKGSDVEKSGTETWPRVSPKTRSKERTDKVRANGPRTGTILRKVGSSRTPAKRQKKKDSKRGTRLCR